MINLKERPHIFWLGLAILILVVESALFYTIWTNLGARVQSTLHAHEVLEQIEALQSEMKDAETGQRGYLLTGKEEYLAPYATAVESIPVQVAQLRQLTSDNQRQQAQIWNLQSLITAKLAELSETLALRRTAGAGQALAAVSSDRGKLMMDGIRVVVQAMRANELSLLDQRNKDRVESSRLLILAMLSGAGILVLVLLAGARAIQRAIDLRTLAEAAERNQRQLLQVTLASIGDGVIATDLNGRVTLINPVSARVTGWPAQEAVGQPLETVFPIVHEGTGNPMENPARRAMREGNIVGLANHTILIARDGRRIPLDDAGSPIIDDSGRVLGAVLIFRDATTKRFQEADLLRRARMLRYSFDAILSTDGEWRIQSWNRGAFEIYGWEEGEVRGRTAGELLRTSPPAAERYQILSQHGQWRGELVQTRKDGAVITVESRQVALRDAEGKIDGILEISRDITARKQAEQELRDQQALLTATVLMAPIGIAVIDARGAILRVNHAVQSMWGGSATRKGWWPDTGKPLQPEDWPEARVLKTGEPVRDQKIDMERFDGARGTLLVSAVPLRDEQGQITGAVIVSEDITARKMAEEALRESEAILRSFFDSPGVLRGVEEVVDGHIVRVSGNAAAVEMLGTGRERISGQMPAEAGPSEETERFWVGLYEESRVTGKPVTVEYARRGADGRERWLLATANYLGTGPSGNPRFGYTALDLTERKRAEEALRASEERFRAQVLASSDVVYRMNPDWSEMRQLQGREFISDTEVPSRDWLQKYIHPDDQQRVLEAIEQAIRTKCVFALEHRVLRVDGALGWTSSRAIPVLDANGEIVEWLGAASDITVRKQALDALAASESRFRALLDSASQGVVAVDEGGRMVLVNARTEEMFGYTRDELLGQPIDVLLPERHRAAHGEHLRGYFAHPRTGTIGFGLDLRGRAKNGSEFPLEVSLSCVQQGGTRWAMALITDITQRKTAEQRLLQSQKMESLGLLAGGVAHDFNNLLVGVIGNASLALDMLPPDNVAVEMLQGVIKAGEQAAHLTRQMLAYSGKGKFVVEPLDLSALVPEMMGLVRPALPKRIAITFDLDRDLPSVEADRGQIQQVFMNLVLNAGEAVGSRDEGLISIRTYSEDVDESYSRLHPEASALRPGKYVCLQVRDTGSGMDEATKAKIFDPFFSTKFTGRGLGLAAVSGIVRGHKGAIAVSSAPRQGSCFTVLFPAVEQAMAKPPVSSDAAAPRGSGLILVVDDEPAVRVLARIALERQGYSVLLAETGLAAIDVLRRHSGEVALVILDVNMPGLDGEETLPQLKRIQPDLKVVMSSGYGESETMILFPGQQVAGFIQKPYTPKDLAEKVRACLGCATQE